MEMEANAQCSMPRIPGQGRGGSVKPLLGARAEGGARPGPQCGSVALLVPERPPHRRC